MNNFELKFKKDEELAKLTIDNPEYMKELVEIYRKYPPTLMMNNYKESYKELDNLFKKYTGVTIKEWKQGKRSNKFRSNFSERVNKIFK